MKDPDVVTQTAPSEPAKRFNEQIDPWLKLGGIVLAGIVGFYTVSAWVHNEAQRAVLEEKFLAKLASRVRPTCIFNSHGSMEADLGAGEYITGIDVILAPTKYGFEITLRMNRHLAYAPVVTGLDADLFPEPPTRTNLNDWHMVLTPNSTVSGLLVVESAAMNTNAVHRFKVEILH